MKEINDFKIDCRNFLKATVKKQEKSPLKYAVVRDLNCLDPKNRNKKEMCVGKFQRILAVLVENNKI